jgi:hypothetical protein
MPSGIPKKGYRMRDGRKIFIGGGKAVANAIHQATLPCVPEVHVPAPVEETDAQIGERLDERFSAMETVAEATFLDMNKSLIISGPAGLGKSFGVMKKAKEAEVLGRVITHITGNVGATGLYRSLFENRHASCSIVFDDADAIFSDEVSLNLLKAACDTTQTRRISWLKEIRMEDDDGSKLPRTIEFDGSIVFITNLDFEAMVARHSKLSPHLSAMMSRSMYLDLMIRTPREYMIRIKQVLFNHGMLKAQNLSDQQGADLVAFLEDNTEKLRELSLRMVIKLANLIKGDPCHWQKLARVTCFKTGS